MKVSENELSYTSSYQKTTIESRPMNYSELQSQKDVRGKATNGDVVDFKSFGQKKEVYVNQRLLQTYNTPKVLQNVESEIQVLQKKGYSKAYNDLPSVITVDQLEVIFRSC